MPGVYAIQYTTFVEINGEKFIDDWTGMYYFENIEEINEHLTDNNFKLIPSDNPLGKVRYERDGIEAHIIVLNKYNRSDYN